MSMRHRAPSSIVCVAALLALLLAGGAAAPPADAQVALGWRLFADRRLSLHGDLACLDCHVPALGYADGKPVATADGLNTPTLYGLARRTTFGWFSPDHASIEAFTLAGPLDNPREMGPRQEATLDQLRADPALVAAFAAAFPDSPQITWERAAQSLAAAIRSIPDPPTGDLSPAARRGQALFAEVGCAGCHQGDTLSSATYLNTGVSADISRNHGQARVPSLIGLAQTAPYFHDGSAATLEDVVRFYAAGGRFPAAAGVTRGVSPITLTDTEVADLVAFLSSR